MPDAAAVQSAAFVASLPTRRRRYFITDFENVTCGAKASKDQAAVLWNAIKSQAPGIASHDHVVVGASRSVAKKYRAVVHGPNVKWVVGANAPDAADLALLSAIDLRRVAAKFDELVIVSGDWRFSALGRRAKTLGLAVHVVTTQHPEQRSMLSRELSAVADLHSVVRLRARSQRAQSIKAAREMSACWRQRLPESAGA